jgi:hypothetical protein
VYPYRCEKSKKTLPLATLLAWHFDLILGNEDFLATNVIDMQCVTKRILKINSSVHPFVSLCNSLEDVMSLAHAPSFPLLQLISGAYPFSSCKKIT